MTVRLAEHRFSRLEAIGWWDQARLRAARVLVVGAGAIGNETIKNLALLGVGNLVVVDMDRVEVSNLSRSVLFREGDEGRPKAAVAVEAARGLYPSLRARAIVGDVLADVGLGWFRWAQVIVGCLDNREARVFVNRCCAMVGRPWIDGGIDVLNGVVRGFSPPATACYECTMGERDWALLNQRRSCSLLARRALAEGGAPTSPTTAAVVGAIQAQEVLKRLHGLESLDGAGFVFEGTAHSSYVARYPISPGCPWHGPAPAVDAMAELDSDTPLRELASIAAGRLGGLDAIDLSRELVERLDCPDCGRSREVFGPLEHVGEAQARCERCGAECRPVPFHSLPADSPRLDRTPRQLGLPAWDVLWPRFGENAAGVELRGDAPPDAFD